MKRFYFILIATLFAVAGFAQKPLAKAEVFAKTTNELRQTQIQARGVSRSSTTTRQKSPRKSLGLVTPPSEATPETYYTASGKLMVNTSNGFVDSETESIQVIVDGTDIYIAGLAFWAQDAWIKGTISGTTATFPAAQQVGDDESYPEWISGSEDGETLCDIVFNFDQVAGVLECVTTYIGECAAEDAFSVYAYWNQPTFTRDEPAGPELVVLPDGLEILPYVMSYDGGSTPINVAVNGNDVYFQGMSYYIPEAWVKGTKDGNLVTFPEMQYMGEYGTYGSSYFFYNGETVFTYDEEAATYTAEGQVYGVIADTYYDGNYTNPVIAPVVEKAAMPANPEVTDMEDSSYGWIVEFDVPITDVNGEPLVGSKLSYIIYSDTEGEIAPLTFTSETHTKLTEDMTEIPYGFTENYDFYATYIYLNELYSEDWNKIGIQSIYRGGGETNATEIQWYTIKEYAIQDYTFNFNAMDVPTSSNVSTDGDILEPMTLNEGTVSLTISTKDGSSTENRFWGTSAGPQLRVYSGTLTFSVPTGYGITQIVFNHNGKWGANTINGVEIANDAEAKVATWTLAEGEEPASVVVVAIAANSQINSIDVTVEGDKLVVLPSGVEPEAWALEGFYSDGSDGQDVFHATEVAFDGTDIYVKGLAYWFEDAWLKGTLEAETGIVTFPSGQFVGEDNYGHEYMVGFDGSDFCDIQYEYDAEAKTLTQYTSYVWEAKTRTGLDEEGDFAYWGFWEVSSLHAGAPTALEIVEVPEGLETETYVLNANEWVEESEAAVETSRMKAPRKAMVSQPYSHQMQVGFDGKDVYFKGFSDDTADMWAKGTLSEDGKTVTIPASQYIGLISTWASNYDYYVTAVNEYYENVDIVLNYDADTNTFTTDQTIVLNGSMFVYYPYQTFTDVTIAKMAEFAATPADPSIDGYKFEETSYPWVAFTIPAEDVEGNALLASKLFYTVWIEEEGEEKPFVVLADEYRYVEEDWTEIPYEWNDEYDIYKGGSKFYINPTDALTGWTKFGIQSIYYGGGERHTSNIVWMENADDVPAVKEVYTEFVAETGTLTYYYDNKKNSRSGVTEVYDPVGNPDAVRFAEYYYDVTKAVIDPSMKDAELTSMKNMFFGGFDSETYNTYYLNYMTEIEGLENLNTSEVTDMKEMFYSCQELTSLDLSTFDTHKVTNMEGMFENCTRLKMLDITSFDVSNVTSFMLMFSQCTNLSTICCYGDWSSSSAQSGYMFYGCRALRGGEGTAYSDAHTDKSYARPDGGTESPGYFTAETMTGINEDLRMKNEESETAIFNLAGQRMNKMQKGINIVGGKKIIMN